MFLMKRYLIFVILFAVVTCNPLCNHWCPSNIRGFVICCDIFNSVLQENQTNQQLYCPQVDCSRERYTSLKACDSDDDCLIKETCCVNPCDADKRCFIGRKQKVQEEKGCPIITDCDKWKDENRQAVVCTNQDDCKRSETCCRVSCDGRTFCQKTVIPPNLQNTGKIRPGSSSIGSDNRIIILPANIYPQPIIYPVGLRTGYGNGYGFGGVYDYNNYGTGCGACSSPCIESSNCCC